MCYLESHIIDEHSQLIDNTYKTLEQIINNDNGIIKEDKLCLDKIYIQAKRWENTVPVSSIRDFAGSLLSKKAKENDLLFFDLCNIDCRMNILVAMRSF